MKRSISFNWLFITVHYLRYVEHRLAKWIAFTDCCHLFTTTSYLHHLTTAYVVEYQWLAMSLQVHDIAFTPLRHNSYYFMNRWDEIENCLTMVNWCVFFFQLLFTVDWQQRQNVLKQTDCIYCTIGWTLQPQERFANQSFYTYPTMNAEVSHLSASNVVLDLSLSKTGSSLPIHRVQLSPTFMFQVC